jgi:hypothetical protein
MPGTKSKTVLAKEDPYEAEDMGQPIAE